MKIVTYNVWNDTDSLPVRTEPLIREIGRINADIFGLQEVMPEFWDELLRGTDYPYHCYCVIPERGDGLAFLSKYPLENVSFLRCHDEFGNSYALNVTFNDGGFRFSALNVHLPWDSVLARETQILAVDRFTRRQKENYDYFILAGDFNGTSRSSVHSFLTGERSLRGVESALVYDDVAGVHAAVNGYAAAPTLDFATNPRWRNNNTKYEPCAVDKILFADNATRGDYFIRNAGIFGTDVSTETGLAPSDHYGVTVEMEFIG